MRESDCTFTVWQEEIASFWHWIEFSKIECLTRALEKVWAIPEEWHLLMFNSFDTFKRTVKMLGYIKILFREWLKHMVYR